MGKKIIIILVLLVVIGGAYLFLKTNFGPQNTWLKGIGKDLYHIHFEKIIQNKEDSTYIAAGYERGVKLGEYKMVFAKINQVGEVVWSKVLDNDFGKIINSLSAKEINDVWFSDSDIPRDDKELVQTVEELGVEANGSCADLGIVSIPRNVKWEIDDYDGMETIEEVHHSWE